MEQQLLDRLTELEKKVSENNLILRKIQRRARAAAAFRLLYWLVLIVLGVISVSLIKPYFDQMKEVYNNAQTTASDYSELLNSIR